MNRLLAIGISCVVGCSGESQELLAGEATEPHALVVYATSYPLAYFAERIGGSAVGFLLFGACTPR